ncbi:MAG: HlyD family efflux transporter periplasmic adaptor subunit [Polyangiaceae bacterium]
MIKNTLGRLAAAIGLAGLVLLGGCEPPPAHPGAFQGVVELDERILGFETGGRITAVAVQRGASVKDGDELATLDDSLARTAREAREAEVAAADARVALLKAGSRGEEIRAMSAELAAARAAEDLAVKEVNRARVLVESGAMAKASLDQAEAALASQKARREAVSERLRGLRNGPRKQEIESAEAQAKAAAKAVVLESEKLERHVLHAHGAGTVLDVHVDPGEIVAPGTPVLTVADTGHPYVDIFVPEGNLDGIRVGSKAKIFVDATTDAFAGAVEDVGRRTEFTPRYLFSEKERPALVVRVRVRVDDPETRLHAGVPAFVEVDRSGAAAPSPSPSGTAEPTKVGEASR